MKLLLSAVLRRLPRLHIHERSDRQFLIIDLVLDSSLKRKYGGVKQDILIYYSQFKRRTSHPVIAEVPRFPLLSVGQRICGY